MFVFVYVCLCVCVCSSWVSLSWVWMDCDVRGSQWMGGEETTTSPTTMATPPCHQIECYNALLCLALQVSLTTMANTAQLKRYHQKYYCCIYATATATTTTAWRHNAPHEMLPPHYSMTSSTISETWPPRMAFPKFFPLMTQILLSGSKPLLLLILICNAMHYSRHNHKYYAISGTWPPLLAFPRILKY